MNELIDGLLALANISRSQLDWEVVDLSELAREIAQDLAEAAPAGRVQVEVQPGLQALGDARLLRVVLHNLIGNAVKFSSRDPAPRVEVGVTTGAAGEPVFHVRDNGEGFDPTQAHRLFVAFQRLHTTAEFPGLGIGLATVQRIVQRHGGRIWAEAQPGRGATFRFVLGARDVPSQPSPLDAAAPA
jgi:light-regulated signal transduction histidine kinase (bacteriophytochrome)